MTTEIEAPSYFVKYDNNGENKLTLQPFEVSNATETPFVHFDFFGLHDGLTWRENYLIE